MFTSENRTVWGDVKLAGIFGLIGGYTSMLSFLLFGVFAGCMTGNTSKTGLAMSQLNYIQFITLFLVVASFIFGSFLSTVIHNKFNYMPILILEGTLLLFIGLHAVNMPYAVWIAATAMGLQNALTTNLSRSLGRFVVRTTHISGTCSDIGILIANKDAKSAIFFGFLLSSYLLGCLAGIWAYGVFSYRSFILGAIAVYSILGYHAAYKLLTTEQYPDEECPAEQYPDKECPADRA